MQEFNRYLDLSARYLKPIDTQDLLARLSSEDSRNALLSPSFNHLRSFGTSLKTIIDSATSDEESDDQTVFPSIKKVALRILDSRSLTLSDNFTKPNHNPCILLSPMSQISKESKLFQLLHENSIQVQSVQLVDFNTHLGKSALLWFYCEDYAQYIFSKFLSGCYKSSEFFEEVSHVKWVDYKIYYPDFPFYAVIIRGFSKKQRLEELAKFFPVSCKRCEMRVVNGIGCGVFVFNSILDVCVMCKRVNGVRIKVGEVIKVHVHPLTQKKYSKSMIETLISDLPSLNVDEKRESFDVYQVINQGLNKSSKSNINPLENLVRGSKKANPLQSLIKKSSNIQK